LPERRPKLVARVSRPNVSGGGAARAGFATHGRDARASQPPSLIRVFLEDTERPHWSLRQRHIIFRLLFQDFERMIGTTPRHDRRRLATLWRVIVEAWFRPQGLI